MVDGRLASGTSTHLWGGDELMQQMGGGAFGGRRKIAVSGKRI
jgi:hypothetical protein